MTLTILQLKGTFAYIKRGTFSIGTSKMADSSDPSHFSHLSMNSPESERGAAADLDGNAMMHDLAVAEISGSLSNKSVALCVAGGIAAIESPRIARCLRRLGATVEAWVTENALNFIGTTSLEWSTSKKVIQNPSGMAEHISNHDAVLVCNATADLLGKVAQGICSDGVTTLIQSAIGSNIPVIFCPTMHESLARSVFVQRNRCTLESVPGIFFLKPRVEESKLKSRQPEEIADEVAHIVNRHFSKTKKILNTKILVTMGGTRVPIDHVRAISNVSTGKFGQLVCAELYRHGYLIDVFLGEASKVPPNLDGIRVIHTPSYIEMLEAVESIPDGLYSGVFMIAAISDFVLQDPAEKQIQGEATAPVTSQFTLKNLQKISSSQHSIELKLVRAKKLITSPSFQKIPFKFACKLTADHGAESQESLKRLFATSGAQLVFWNTIQEAFENGEICGNLLNADSARFLSTENTFGPNIQLACKTKNIAAQKIAQSFIEFCSGNE